MAYDKWKNEAGQGGKLGHSNMSHWDYTEWLKVCSKVNRRMESKKIIDNLELDDFEIEIGITLINTMSEEDKDNFYDLFIDFIEDNKLIFGGGLNDVKINGCIDYSSTDFD